MHLRLLIILAGVFSIALSAAVPAHGLDNALVHVVKRQMNASSVCTTSGVDYQNGGVYFINTNSNESFTFVSTFEGCNNDTADLSLVNDSTGDQYECGQVPTVPDNTPETATCPVLKSQLTSGKYLIIAIGNNGNGKPFSYQREFTIVAGPQQNITSYPTGPTITTMPTITANCESGLYGVADSPRANHIASNVLGQPDLDVPKQLDHHNTANCNREL